MKGHDDVIKALNLILAAELTAINQYFLHSRILKDKGYEKLAQLEYKSSIDEMKHADELIQRILYLEGYPNLQVLNKLHIGQDVEEILRSDLALEQQAVERLKKTIVTAEKHGDFITRDLMRSILSSEESHEDWLSTQLSLMSEVGVANYLQTQIMMDDSYPE
ncbi:MAG: bacterioferritin [Proteobacteria bacterium]|nr:bacterioferritin [Pseudomonadota bacterium]